MIPATGALASFFGPLELRVLEALWARGGDAKVRDLLPSFPGIAYTTLMTTLDRLHKKGFLDRRRSGLAFLYAPRSTREQLEAALAGRTLDAIVASVEVDAIRPLLATFVDAVSRRDHLALDELEQAVRTRRRALRRGKTER